MATEIKINGKKIRKNLGITYSNTKLGYFSKTTNIIDLVFGIVPHINKVKHFVYMIKQVTNSSVSSEKEKLVTLSRRYLIIW